MSDHQSTWTRDLRNVADLADAYDLPEPRQHMRFSGGAIALVVTNDADLHAWEVALGNTATDLTAVAGYLVIAGMAADTMVKVATEADVRDFHDRTALTATMS